MMRVEIKLLSTSYSTRKAKHMGASKSHNFWFLLGCRTNKYLHFNLHIRIK